MSTPISYAAYTFSDEIRLKSSSGGIFTLLAENVINAGGVAFGTEMDDECCLAKVAKIHSIDEIERLRGSKYIQSRLGSTLANVKGDLENGKTVLFTGTGCQINGLLMFLGKDYPNLFLLDVICHGVPSPQLWKKYLEHQEKKYGKIGYVNFRCKDDSWQNYGMKENQHFISKDTDSFMRMFLRNYCLRPSCYECHAKDYKKSDITIGDFWGIDQVAPEMNDGKGTSLVIVRTEKGQKLFDSIKDNLKWEEVSYEKGVKENSCEYKSANRPKERDLFFTDLNTLSFEEMEKKYAADVKMSFKHRAKDKIKRMVSKSKKFRG